MFLTRRLEGLLFQGDRGRQAAAGWGWGEQGDAAIDAETTDGAAAWLVGGVGWTRGRERGAGLQVGRRQDAVDERDGAAHLAEIATAEAGPRPVDGGVEAWVRHGACEAGGLDDEAAGGEVRLCHGVAADEASRDGGDAAKAEVGLDVERAGGEVDDAREAGADFAGVDLEADELESFVDREVGRGIRCEVAGGEGVSDGAFEGPGVGEAGHRRCREGECGGFEGELEAFVKGVRQVGEVCTTGRPAANEPGRKGVGEEERRVERGELDGGPEVAWAVFEVGGRAVGLPADAVEADAAVVVGSGRLVDEDRMEAFFERSSAGFDAALGGEVFEDEAGDGKRLALDAPLRAELLDVAGAVDGGGEGALECAAKEGLGDGGVGVEPDAARAEPWGGAVGGVEAPLPFEAAAWEEAGDVTPGKAEAAPGEIVHDDVRHFDDEGCGEVGERAERHDDAGDGGARDVEEHVVAGVEHREVGDCIGTRGFEAEAGRFDEDAAVDDADDLRADVEVGGRRAVGDGVGVVDHKGELDADARVCAVGDVDVGPWVE